MLRRNLVGVADAESIKNSRSTYLSVGAQFLGFLISLLRKEGGLLVLICCFFKLPCD